MIPLGHWFSDPAEVIRGGTILGAIVFQLGSLSLYRNIQLDFKWHILAVFATALVAVNWGAFSPPTPDLLIAGLLLAGYSTFQRALRCSALAPALFAGILFGLSYLAKTPGLLFSLGIMVSLSVLVGLVQKRT